MSQESDDQFDKFTADAAARQVTIIYVCAILPSGECVQIHTDLLPESLEEIGPMPQVAARAMTRPLARQIAQQMERRGQAIARLMTSTINPMMRAVVETLVAKQLAYPFAKANKRSKEG